jgi:hypothetical protein
VDVHLMRVGRAEYWVHLGEMSRRVIWEGEHILYNLCLTNDTSSNSSHIYVRMLQYMSLCQCPQAVGLCC